MNFARVWYQRFRQLVHEIAKFGVVGALGFVVTDGGSNVLHFDLGQGPLKANIAATVAATVVTYLGNRYWTFRHRQGSTMTREYVLFFVLNGVGLLIQLACLWFTVYALGLHGRLPYNVALVLGIGLGTLFRFWSYRRWVWVAPDAPSGDAAERPAPGPVQPQAPPSGARTSGGRQQPVGAAGPTWHVNAKGAPTQTPGNGHGGAGARRAAGDGGWRVKAAQVPVRVNGHRLGEQTPQPEPLDD